MFEFTTDRYSDREQLLKQPAQVIHVGRMLQIGDAAKFYGLSALLIYFHAVC